MTKPQFGDWTTVYIVLCLDDLGVYVQATSQRFAIKADAEKYAEDIAEERNATVVEVPR